MNGNKVFLTGTDNNAVLLGDSNYINNKGANLYRPDTYMEAVEYYRLAAAMGNVYSISNLGYCYLYGRGIEANLSLALAYFRVAANKGDVDAAYKLGDVYGNDKWGVKDQEMSIYYYRMAASFVIGTEWEKGYVVAYCTELQKYPSLCYALGRELSLGGDMYTDIDRAYQFLKHAEKGYKTELANGNEMYAISYQGVIKLIADSQFDDIREQYDEFFDDDDEEDSF